MPMRTRIPMAIRLHGRGERMSVADSAIIGLLDIIHAHIDNGDIDEAIGVINRTKATLDGTWSGKE